MDKKQMIIILCLFGVFLSALSVASASDVAGNETFALDMEEAENDIILSSGGEDNTILGVPSQSFNDLNDTIQDPSIPVGGTVYLNGEFSYESGDLATGIDIKKNLTIDGRGSTINAHNQAAIFNVIGDTHIVLMNITFIGGNSTNGGAINVVSGGSVDIIDCNFINNTATNHGGAIYIADNASTTITSKITRSTFDSNGAVSGGAVYVNGSSLYISDSEFSKDSAKSYGGSIFIDGVLHVTQTTFDNGRAGSGGSIYLNDTFQIYSTIDNSTFTNSYVSGDGGAVYVSADNVHMNDLIFRSNTAGDDGGAIYWEGSTGVIDNITCIDNKGISLDKSGGDTSSTRGGTICLTGSDVIITKSHFSLSSAYMDENKNYSKVDGGALFITGNNVIVNDTTFDSCNATNNGGAVYVIGNNTHIYNCDFNNCIARDAGALYVDGTGCSLYNSTFTNNIANDDGGAIYWNGDEGIIYNITCNNNKGVSGYDPLEGKYSSTRGGTICLTGSRVTLTKSTFKLSSAYMVESRNYSKVDGGALFITGNDIVVNDTTFDSCTATNNGGAVYIIGNNTHLYNADFNNCAARDGGAIYVQGDDCKLFNATITKNIANDDGGAIYWDGDNGEIYNITCIDNKGVSGYDPLDGKFSNSKGGTICLTGSNVTIDQSSFTQSSAKVDGGAIFITGNDVKVTNSNFSDCISTESSGGAVYIIGNNTHVIDCGFDNCRVDVKGDHRGGAIYVAGNDANITGSTFTNTKALIGGAICIAGDGTVVDDSTFAYNDAVSTTGGTGGAINIDGSNAIISNSNFSHGTAVNYGGAIAVWGDNALLVNNTIDQSKTTKYNGGAVYVFGTNATISLSNFTQCNALGDQYAKGGAIDVDGDDTHILSCNFDDCDARYGGVIYVSGEDAVIDDSTFKNSEAKQGGAIYVEGTNTCISHSNFTDISADNYGGSIYVAGSNANISESNFERSKVKNFNGGAIYIAGENTNIEKSNFTSTEALNSRNKALGGAIYIEGPDAVIKESDFDECKASEGGGAIYAYGNNARIEDSTFDSNTAKFGGSIYLTSWGAVVTGSNITGSIASENGGGIYVAEGSILITESNFEDCTAKGTSATKGGGAIYINGPDTHISASNFTNNKAPSGTARGGSIFVNGERTIIDGSNFEAGTAYLGGEIYIEGVDALVDTSSFNHSSSRSAGGSIYVKGDEATIRLSTFDNIYAASNGGAIYVSGERTDILNSSFRNCTVSGNLGGAIYIDDIGTTVAFSNFTLSKAKEGGAIYIRGEDTTITYCNLHNNSANHAGAIKVYGDDTIISNCNMTYNEALTGNGGAMDIGGSNASVYYSWFDHNVAKLDGGAINWLGGHGDDSIIGSTFTNNIAYDTNRGGGAIYWTQGSVIAAGGLIKDSIFINNTAAGRHGGAIDWFHALDSVIDNCLFVNNTSNSDGGALYTGDQGGLSKNMTIVHCQFYNNTAGKYGGAIANQMADSYLYNNTFDHNKAMAGGGSILMKEGPADNCIIDNCYIYNSYVGTLSAGYGEGGGAILLGVSGDDNITISNCVIWNSTIARGPGGAIAIFGKLCSLINVSIENASTQHGDGGAIYWKGTSGNLDNVTIFNASSNSNGGDRSSDGGAIHLSGWDSTLNDIKIYESSANNDENCAKTNYGGAIYVSGGNDVLTNIIIDNATSKNAKMNGGGGAIFYDGTKGTLINATISNTLANGNGGAIYWKGSSPVQIANISITYSQTEVIGSANSADGGAIYSTTITQLNNVSINGARAYKDKGDVRGGAIYWKDGNTLNNVTIIGSRAVTDDGTSYGGAVFSERQYGSNSIWVYNSTFEENNADLGGGLYFQKLTSRIYDSTFTGNVANRDGGALYANAEDALVYTTTFDHNSAKRGGAIFAENAQVQISDSLLEFNTAEEKGGALYYNYNNKATSGQILRTSLVNNTAFQGSAIYGTKFNKFSLVDTVLLDNQANSNKFINKAVGVDDEGHNYTSAVFLGFDNILNAIWQEGTVALACSNVTYWGVNGRTKANSPPSQSDREVNINVTVEMYDENGVQLDTEDLTTDKDGKVTYYFDAEDDKTYYFAYVHKSDRYYTYLRDTLSNSSLVKIYVHNPIFYAQNQTVLIELTDGAWGNLNGTVIVTFNDTAHTTFEIEVINGTGNKTGISNLPIGYYNATAYFRGDINHTGDTDWTVFEVVPYDDLHITKDVNITADVVNVTDYVKYTITVINHGPSDAYGVNVTERLSPYLKLIRSKATKGSYNLTGGYWYIGELDVDDFETLTIFAQVIHMGPITNTVWVTGLGNDTNMSNNVASAHNFTAVPITDLGITKKVNVTKNVINVLDKIRFDITVHNYGPCDATGVIVEELLDDHLKLISSKASVGRYRGGTWVIGNLANGSTATLTIYAEVVYSGKIANAVHVSGYENESDYTNNHAAIKNKTAVANVDLQINKEVNVSGVVNVTDKIKFTITVTNNGPCNATGVYVAETLDSHLRHISNETTIGEYDGTTWIIGNLNKGEVHTLTIFAEVISAGNISNFVAIFGNDNDTNKSNNQDEIPNITAIDIVDLEIHKTADKAGIVNVSDIIKFTITVRNNGPCMATNVNVTEKLSPHLKLVSYSTWGGGVYDVNKGIWYIGNLTKGDWRDLVIYAQVVSAGNISNVVVVNGTQKDTNESNNRDEIPNITARDVVDLQITKKSNFTESVINVTDYIKYTITVFNDGPSNATNVNVSEVLSSHLKLIKYETDYGYYNSAGGYWYIGRLNNQSTAVLTIYAQVISNGTIANVVIVNGTELDRDPSNNRAEIENITSQYIVDLQIKKEVVYPSQTDIDITQPIMFKVTVYNAGPCNATGVFVGEPLSNILNPLSIYASKGDYDLYTWFIDDLACGETATLTIVAKSQYAGYIENEVNVTSREVDTNLSNNKDNITPIHVSAHIDLGINKTVNVNVVNVSDWVEFTVTAYNNGPCNVSGVYVLEALDFNYLGSDYKWEATPGTIYNGYTWDIGKLDAGANATLKITAQVIKQGNFSNYVEVFGWGNDTDPNNKNATVNITAKPIVDLRIKKEVNVDTDVVDFGDTIVFTISVWNDGPCDATNVNVTEVLDSHLTMDHYDTWGSNYDVDEGVWYIGTLANGDWRQLVIYANVTAVGNISNVVVVKSSENDTNESNNWDDIPNITAIPVADLQIKKEINVTTNIIHVLDQIKYTITVYNAGPCNATNVNVTEVLNSHLKFIDYDTEYGYYNLTGGYWYIGNLTNKTTAVLTIYANVTSPGAIENVVIVNGTEKDPNPYNNRDEVTNITAVNVFDLQINKTVNVTKDVHVTDVIKFTVTVYNAGPCNVTGVYVMEPLSDRLTVINCTVTKGDYDGYTWNIYNMTKGETVNMTIIARVAYSGIIENEVVVNGSGIDTNLSNNKDKIDPLNATTSVDLSISKISNATGGIVNVSDFIEFIITASNDCDYNATGVYVLEALDFNYLGRDYTWEATEGTTYNGYTWVIGNLNARETATLKIRARVIAPGNFSNYVEIRGYDPDTNPDNNNETVNITANPVVDLAITKEVDLDSDVVYYGDEIRFIITVVNRGPCDATNVNVTEELSPYINMLYYDADIGDYNVTEGVWHIGDMAMGEWARLIIYANVTAVGNISNVVVVNSTEDDRDPSNNRANITNITVEPIVDLRINKTVNVTATELNVNDVIRFTVTVWNDGPCNATNVYVREPLSYLLRPINIIPSKGRYIDSYTWVIGDMEAGENATLIIDAKIVYSGIIENEVHVTSNDTDIDPSNNDDNITPIRATTKVDRAIYKTVNVNGTIDVGDMIEFTITAYNYGPCNASGVYVLEALDFNHLSFDYTYEATLGTYDGYTWYIGYLDAGANATLKIRTLVTEMGNFSNYVEIFGFDEDTNSSNDNASVDNITAVPVVDLKITKEVNVDTGVVYYGDIVVFTITVVNDGPSDATNVNVTEKLSPLLNMIEYSTWDSYYDVDEGVWHIGDLARYDWRQLVIIANVTSIGNFSNFVSVNSTEKDTNESNNNDTIPNITAKPVVDLAITKEVNSTTGFVDVNDYIKYTITVFNYGPYNDTNVNVTEALSPYIRFIDYDTEYGYYNVTGGYWYIGDLANGTNVTLTIYAQVIKNGTFIPNTVVVSGTEKDTDPSNNRDEVIIAALPITDLRIEKEVNVTSDVVGVTDYIKFIINVYNDGPCDATGVYVIESLNDKLKLIRNVTSVGEWDGYTWNIGKLANGSNATMTIYAQVAYEGNITNEVIVYGFENETDYDNNNASIPNMTAVSFVDWAITKEVNVSGDVNVSDIIKFTITVTNYGPCNATGVYVSEALDTHLRKISYTVSKGDWDGATWIIGNLTKGEIQNLTIIAEVISPGNITNFVAIFGNENDTNSSNNNASIPNITAVEAVDLVINKTVNVDSNVVHLGDSIIFTVTVRNKGPCDATDVNVTEKLDSHLRFVNSFTWDSYYDVDAGMWYIGNLTRGDWRQLVIVAEVASVGNFSNFVSVNCSQNDTDPSNNNASIPNITAINDVDLEINKTVNVDTGVVHLGDTIIFTVTVKNYGPCVATNVNVTEVLDSHLSMVEYSTWDSYYDVDAGVWYIGNLTKDDWRQLIIIAKVISVGNISNVVVVNCSENDTDPSNNNASIPNITAINDVDLEINKTVNVDSDVVCLGDTIIFTVTVKNYGPCDATNVNVTEALDAHLKLVSYSTWDSYYDVDAGVWYIGDLAKDDWRQLVIVAEVVFAGNISNVVVVTSSENDTNKSNNNASIPNITAVDAVDLYITKSVNVKSGFVNVTDIIEFDIVVYNAGPCDATNVNVTEMLSPHLKFISSITENGHYDADAGMWYIGDLANQSRAYLTIFAQVISEGTISNVVVVNSSQKEIDNKTNRDEIENITALPIFDLSIAKTVNATDVNVSDHIKYTITIVNAGPCNASDVVVWDKLSDLLEFISFASTRAGIRYDYASGRISVGDLKVNETVGLIIVAKVIGNGTIENAANITGYGTDTNKSNNNDTSDNVTAHPVVDLSISKTYETSTSTDIVIVGDVIVYSITVHNYGPSNATDVEVNETLSRLVDVIEITATAGFYDPVSGIWDIGNLAKESTATLTIRVKVIGNGTIENVVSVTSYENDTDPSNNNASSDNITALPDVVLNINKEVNVTEVTVGDCIEYTIEISNYGLSDATDVYVIDNLSPLLEFISFDATRTDIKYDSVTGKVTIGKLASSENVVMKIVARVISSGNISNIAVVSSKESIPKNDSSENVTAEKLDTPIILIPENITYGDDETIIVILPDSATGTVNITVNGKAYNDVEINGGIAELIIPDLAGGNYNVTVVYGGDNVYVGNATDGKFNVARAVPIITIEVVDIWHGEIEVLNVTVNAPGTVNITVFGITVEVPLNHSVTSTDVLKAARKASYDGKATWNLINLPVGRYPAFAIYNENENYTSVNTSDVFHVRNKPSTVVVSADDIYVGEDAVVNVQVGPRGVTGNVTLVVDGVTYELNITEDGKASVTVSGLPAGLKDVYVRYNGDILYRPSENTTVFNVLKLTPPIGIDSPDITVGEDGVITVTVPSDATGTITIEIDGKTYTGDVVNGTAVFIVPGLSEGTHDIRAYYSGDDRYLPVNATGSINVNPVKNDTSENATDIGEVHNGIALSQYATGNPIFILLIILLSVFSRPLRRFRK